MFQQLQEEQQVQYYQKSFSLTRITYPSNDTIIGPTLALLSLLPPFAIVALTSSTLVYKDVTASYLLLGCLLCALGTSILKNLIIQQPRPLRYYNNGEEEEVKEEEEYGMPSNHSSFAFFGATFIILYILRAGRRSKVWSGRRLALLSSSYHTHSQNTTLSATTAEKKKNGNVNKIKKTTTSAFFFNLSVKLWYHLHNTITIVTSLLLAIGCAYSRIYLGYHTSNQVYVGSILGTVLGLMWYRLFETKVVQKGLIWLDTLIDELECARISRAVCCIDDDIVSSQQQQQQQVMREKNLKQQQMKIRTSNLKSKNMNSSTPNQQNEEDKQPTPKSFRELLMERKKMNQNNNNIPTILPSPIGGITTTDQDEKKKNIDTLDELIMNCAPYLTGSPTEYITWLRTELKVNTISNLVTVVNERPEVLVNGNGNVGMWQKKKFCEAVLLHANNNAVVSVVTRDEELKKKD